MHPVIFWQDGRVGMLDQRLLPWEERVVWCGAWPEVAEGIRAMVIRGAPAIGIAAAMGLALALHRKPDMHGDEFDAVCRKMAETRPTAVNLFWAIERMSSLFHQLSGEGRGPRERADALLEEARRIDREDVDQNRTLGRLGAEWIPDGARILTHCNAGALATGGYGTALGVLRAVREEGKRIHVLADETRPYLQGARLTAWEMKREGIPCEVITDGMAGHFMARGEIDAVVVGADRVAGNGDVANKIGTYGLAVLARFHQIPFYVAAPWSTVDLGCISGADIPIEERSQEEVLVFAGKRIAPEGVGARHPAFDVTPAALVTALFTERGVVRAPWRERLKELSGQL